MSVADRYFDDFSEGEVFTTGSYRMTEERMIAFATEFDPQVFHTDPEAAADTIYGGLIASGWHTGSVLMKLLSGLLGPSSLGSPGCDALRWLAPVRAGDELELRATVLETRPSTTKPDRGIVRLRNEVLNQRGDVVMSLESAMLMARARGVEGVEGEG